LSEYQRTGAAGPLSELYAATRAPLLRVAFAVTRDAGLAEDAVQAVFVDLLRLASRYDASRPALPWLAGIVRRKALKARRVDRRRPEARRLRLRTGDEELSIDHHLAFQALQRLAEPYRSVGLLRWRYGISPAEIASLRGERAATTRSILSRALSQMRRIASTLGVLVGVGLLARLLNHVRGFAGRTGLPAGEMALAAATTGASGTALAVGAAVLAGTLGVLAPEPILKAATAQSLVRALPAEDWDRIHRPRPTVADLPGSAPGTGDPR
jgi:RNA polymerase sigma factor (sigma-70 family)